MALLSEQLEAAVQLVATRLVALADALDQLRGEGGGGRGGALGGGGAGLGAAPSDAGMDDDLDLGPSLASRRPPVAPWRPPAGPSMAATSSARGTLGGPGVEGGSLGSLQLGAAANTGGPFALTQAASGELFPAAGAPSLSMSLPPGIAPSMCSSPLFLCTLLLQVGWTGGGGEG